VINIRRMQEFRGQWVAITGASSGIGEKMAEILAEAGAKLVLVARRRDRLQKIADRCLSTGASEVQVVEVDLTSADGVEKLIGELSALPGGLYGLVNNAGFGATGSLDQESWPLFDSMLELNVRSLVRLSHWAAGALRAQGRGGILNVASTAAFQPLPGMALYGATKAFVSTFSAALHQELKYSGVKVSCLHPGKTETEFFDAAGMSGKKLFFFRIPGMTAQKVAQIGLHGWVTNRPQVVAGGMNRFIVFLTRLAPLSFQLALAHSLFREPEVRISE
jgi:short-subunit dehydrogenase